MYLMVNLGKATNYTVDINWILFTCQSICNSLQSVLWPRYPCQAAQCIYLQYSSTAWAIHSQAADSTLKNQKHTDKFIPLFSISLSMLSLSICAYRRASLASSVDPSSTAGMSHLWPTGRRWPKTALNEVQHKIVNLLKIFVKMCLYLANTCDLRKMWQCLFTGLL